MITAIVVSGGDAPGINAAIETYARLASEAGDHALGVQDGFAGMLAGELEPLDIPLLTQMAGRGGSILRSSRAPALGEAGGRERLQAAIRERKIDNLLLFGGDGTLRHALPLLESWGISCIVLPTTIDNDITGTDYTLGHDSACNFARAAVDGIRATAQALPGRFFMLETLGAPSGHLALAIARASGAHAVLLPEYEVDLDWLADRVTSCVKRDGYALAVLSEATPGIERIVAEIPARAGIRLRYTALGHAQRGADASHLDRAVAREMSRLAWRALKDGCRLGVVLSRDGALSLREGSLPPGRKPAPDYEQYARINGL